MNRGQYLAIISLSLSLIALGPPANATALALLRTPSEIAIAADSVEVWDTGMEDANICKIEEQEGVIFAIAGLTNVRGAINVSSLAKEALKAGGGLRLRITIFDRLIKVPLQAAADVITETYPSLKAEYLEKKAITAIMFAEVKQGIPIMFFRNFAFGSDNQTVMSTGLECPGNDCQNHHVLLLVGPADLKERFSKEHRHLDSNVADLARAFVQEQIDQHIPKVGPPIDLVRMTNRGIEWIQRKPGC